MTLLLKEGKKLEIEEGAVYQKETKDKHKDSSIRKAQTAFFFKKDIG